MNQICIIHNALDQKEQTIIQYESALKTFLEYKAKYPQAKIYKGNPCPATDVTPSLDDKASIARLLETNEDYSIVCYPGEMITAVNWVVGKIFGAAVSAFVKIPKLNNGSGTTGSSNNNLSNTENRQRIKEKVPTILGIAKSIPDLFAPAYRHFKDDIEVEELFLSVSDNPVQLSQFKESDTPIEEMPGKSLTAYGLSQSVIGAENIYKIGDDFDEIPIIAKQVVTVNGQTAIPPNSTRIERSDIYFQHPNVIKCTGDAGDFEKFVVNESIVIDGANFGIADITITGQVEIDPDGQSISITSSQTVGSYQAFRKINITSMLIVDPVAGQLDLAGLYNISSINFSDGVYKVFFSNPSATNTNFSLVSEKISTTISANLTANTANIFLDGSYVVTGIDKANKRLTLATPSTINLDWSKLANLSGAQTTTTRVKLRGSQENFVGWFTVDSEFTTGLLLNFRAGNGVYQGSDAKKVEIQAEYQQVVKGVATGQIFTKNITITGKGNNRDAIGASLWIELPFSGAVRFRARRINDNGDAADLVDEVKFYLAYAYHKLEQLTYDDVVLIRARTVATPNATSQDSRQLNCIAESLVYTYRDGVKSAERIASRNIADLTIMLALHPKIGRLKETHIDFDQLYAFIDQAMAYFGSAKMTEFNYTLDDANKSLEEVMRLMAAATCSHDRRSHPKLYYELESADNEPLILFNHRNKESKKEVRTYSLKVENNYDGLELTYIDSESGWIEKTLKFPNDMINNPKKINGTGIIYTQQAHVVGWREWNKLKFNRISTRFNAQAESDLVFEGDCILCTDDVRIGDCTSGEIRAWTGLSIKVSQPFLFEPSKQYVIHLQMKSGQIDSMKVTQGQDRYHFLLERPPFDTLITTGNVFTVYSVTTEDRQNEQKFIVAKKVPGAIFENEITAINFDERYYRRDKDIINNLI